jgi:hypothetical protein
MAILLDLPSTPSRYRQSRTSPRPQFATRHKRKIHSLHTPQPTLSTRLDPLSSRLSILKIQIWHKQDTFNTRIWRRFPVQYFINIPTTCDDSPSFPIGIPAILSNRPVPSALEFQSHTRTKFDRKMISPPPCFEPASLDPQYRAQRP